MKKLTKNMEAALNKMELYCKNGKWLTSYDLNIRLGTLRALESRGLIESRREFGYMFFPQNCIFWKPIEKD